MEIKPVPDNYDDIEPVTWLKQYLPIKYECVVGQAGKHDWKTQEQQVEEKGVSSYCIIKVEQNSN